MEAIKINNFQTAAFRYRFGPMGVQALSFIIQVWSKLYVTKTAGELLFNGYEDRFLSKVKYVTGAQDKFGWFYQVITHIIYLKPHHVSCTI